MRDKKMNLIVVIICIVAIGATIVINMSGNGKKKSSGKQQIEATESTTTNTTIDITSDDLDVEQYINGNTLKNNPDSDDNAYDTVDSIVKVEDDLVNPIFTDMPDIKRSLPSMIEAQIIEQKIDLGLNNTVTVHPEPVTLKETEDIISFEMFFDELIPVIHIEYKKIDGDMKVLIYERTQENIKKYGWDKVLEKKYNISVD